MQGDADISIVKVNFGPDDGLKQKEFLTAMSEVGLIGISRAQIDDWYKEELSRIRPTGYENRIVLHSKEEFARFIYVMGTFFKGVEWNFEEPTKVALNTDDGDYIMTERS